MGRKKATSIKEIVDILEGAQGGPLSARIIGESTFTKVSRVTILKYVRDAQERNIPLQTLPGTGVYYPGEDFIYLENVTECISKSNNFKRALYLGERVRNRNFLPSALEMEKRKELPAPWMNKRLFIADVTSCIHNSSEARFEKSI